MRAVQSQVAGDFAPVWNRTAWLDTDPVDRTDPRAWRVIIKDRPGNGERHDARAWHGFRDGVPTAFVYAQSAKDDHQDWSSYLSHEVLEMLVDERTDSLVRVSIGYQAQLWYREVCDPVMGTDYRMDGVALANFVYPSWFEAKGLPPYDRCGKLTAPFQVLVSGYATYLEAPGGLVARQHVGVAFPGVVPVTGGPAAPGTPKEKV